MQEPDQSPFQTIRQGDLVAEVARRLEDAILSGQLQPGQRLGEAELARRFGVSRAPVREAARQLQQRGLLIAEPRRGFFVRPISVQEIDDVYGVRICLESCAAITAAPRLTKAQFSNLSARVEAMRAHARAGREDALVEEDFAFHVAICDASGNRRLAGLITDLAAEIRMMIALIGRIYDDPHRIAETHQPLLDVLTTGDEATIRAAWQTHIEAAWRGVRQLFQQRGDPNSLSHERQ